MNYFDISIFALEPVHGRNYAIFAPKTLEELRQLETFLEGETLVKRATSSFKEDLQKEGEDLRGAHGGTCLYFRTDEESGEALLSEKGEQLVVMVFMCALGGKAVGSWMAFAVKPEHRHELERDEDGYCDSVMPVLVKAALRQAAGGSN